MSPILRSALLMAFGLSQVLTVSAQSGTTTTKSIQLIPTPTSVVNPPTQEDKGCFKSSDPLENHGPYDFQSDGNCQKICYLLQKPVFALSDGNLCWCGDLLPANNTYVPMSQCDTPCAGFKEINCGGPKRWRVLLTKYTLNRVDYYEPPEGSSSSATAEPESTVIVTTTPTASPQKSESKPNVAGIAAGVVVGVVALVGIVIGVWFFLRQRKRRELEEEHKRQAAVNQFFSGGKSHHSQSSMSDSRLDPDIMHRRQSDGSIADNQDYSRRILKVTNPDGY